jgi:hypothetical protein
MPAPRLIALGALIAAALAATGCAGAAKDSAKDFKGEQRNVATAVEDLQSEGRKSDGGKICDTLLSTRLVAQIKRSHATTCPTAVNSALDDVDTTELQVKRVAVNGGRATAQVASKDKGGDRLDTLSLVKERGAWRIDSLGR